MLNFEAAIKNLSEKIKKEIVNGFANLNFAKNKNEEVNRLLEILYKNMNWDTEQMDFSKTNSKKKYQLLRSIYTIIQMEKPLFGRPYLKCHKCGGKIMVKDNDPYSLPMCQGCGLIMDYDDSLIKL